MKWLCMSREMSNTKSQIHAPKPRRQESWWDVIKTVLLALLIAGTAAAQPFNIPTASMQGTLLVGDYLFVSKASYGYSRYSLPGGYLLPLPQGRIFASLPERGDVIVFKTPMDNKTDYVKRLIGLPGDRIQMKDGILYINDKPVPKIPVAPFIEDIGGHDRERYGDLDNTDVFVVPGGHYFVMGDNRDNSLDSRVPVDVGGVGYVPFENLVGKAEIIFFSVDDNTRLWEVWKWPSAIGGSHKQSADRLDVVAPWRSGA